jgi:hypothetical protein
MPGWLHRNQKSTAPAADVPSAPATTAPATTAPSNSAAQEQMGSSIPDSVYLDAMKNAGPVEVDHRYDEPDGYVHSKNEKSANIKPKTADELRKDEKPVEDIRSERGAQSATSWATTEYLCLFMGECQNELAIVGAAWNPWKAIADDPSATKQDRAKLPKMAKEVKQHAPIALKHIDHLLEILDRRHSDVLGVAQVKAQRDVVLQTRQMFVMMLQRVGDDDSGAVLDGLIKPEDPAMLPGGWSPGAPPKPK